MPAAAVVAGASGIVSAGMSLYQGMKAGEDAKRYEQAIKNYKRQQLVNSYEGLQVSTMGADLQEKAVAQSIENATTDLASGGSRALVGGLNNLVAQQITQDQQIAAGLDAQYVANQNKKAEGYALVQGMQETREKDDLLGLGNALNTARQEKAGAYNQLASTISGVGQGIASGMIAGGGGKELSPIDTGGMKSPNLIAPKLPSGNTALPFGKLNPLIR